VPPNCNIPEHHATRTADAPCSNAVSGPTQNPSASRSQLKGTAVLSLTMLGVSAGNYLLNLATAHLLEPAEFGDANLAINLVLAAAAIAATLQLVTARAVAAGGADPRRLTGLAWALGGFVGASLAAGAWWLQGALSTSTPWLFVLVGAGLPVYFAQAVSRGALQGRLRIGRLAASYAAEAGVRIVVALGLLALGAGVTGVAAAIAVSFVASAFVARGPSADEPADDGTAPTDLRSVTAMATVLLVGQVVIANGDVVMAKWLLDPDAAGGYAAAALIGRSLFFLSWSVVHATFPVIAGAPLASIRRAATRRALVLVITACSIGVGALTVFGSTLAPVLLGDSSQGALDLLVPYAIATSLFAVANLLASVGLAAGRRGAPSMLALGAVLQTLLLLTAGNAAIDLVWAQVVAMAITLALVAAAHLAAEHRASDVAQPTVLVDGNAAVTR